MCLNDGIVGNRSWAAATHPDKCLFSCAHTITHCSQVRSCNDTLVHKKTANERVASLNPCNAPRKQQWRADLYHLARCVYSGGYFWPSVFTQLNIDSNVYRCLRFEPKTKCSASSWAERWMFVCDLIPHHHHSRPQGKKKKSLCLKYGSRISLRLSLDYLFTLTAANSLAWRTMWGYAFYMCWGFPCLENDVKGVRGSREGDQLQFSHCALLTSSSLLSW